MADDTQKKTGWSETTKKIPRLPHEKEEAGEDPAGLGHQAGSGGKPGEGETIGDPDVGEGEGEEIREPGEGDHEADRRYRLATEKFVAGGKVDPAADEARRAMDDDSERGELEAAAEKGRAGAADPDPELSKRR